MNTYKHTLVTQPETLIGVKVVIHTNSVGWEVVPFEASSQEWLVMKIIGHAHSQRIRQRHHDKFGDQEFYAYLEGELVSGNPNRHGRAFQFCVVPSSTIYPLRETG